MMKSAFYFILEALSFLKIFFLKIWFSKNAVDEVKTSGLQLGFNIFQ